MRKRLLSSITLGALLGCNAILGIESGVFDPAATPDASGADTSTIDFAFDAKAPADATALVDAASADPDPPDAGPCVDTENNPRHCGRCNHDCGPGTCANGTCQPGVVVSGIDSAVLITATATHVYYASDNGILRRAPAFGGAAAELFDAGAQRPFGHNLVVLGDYIYFADRPRSRVARCPLLGACTPETVVPGFSKPWALATANGDLYVAEGTFGTKIVVCKSPHCAQQDPVVSGDDGISLVSTSATDIAWATIDVNGRASIKTKPLAGGPTVQLLQDDHAGLLGTSSLLVSGRSVYAVYLGQLLRFGLDSTSKEPFGDIGATETLRKDFASLWYGDFYTGNVYQRAIGAQADAGSDLIAHSDGHLYDLALADTSVYWAAGTAIWRLVR